MHERSLPMLPTHLREARVLLVDDQELNLRVLKQVLEKAGLTNITMMRDATAVAPMVARQAPDIIVLDLHMPGLDGWGVMESLKPQLDAAGYLPILVLTADVTDDARWRALESGARDFLVKPIDAIELILRVRNLLDTRMLYLELELRNVDLEQRVRERTAQVEAAQLETLERLERTAQVKAARLETLERLARNGDPLNLDPRNGDPLYGDPLDLEPERNGEPGQPVDGVHAVLGRSTGLDPKRPGRPLAWLRSWWRG
jgi:putative two-component system response regulator